MGVGRSAVFYLCSLKIFCTVNVFLQEVMEIRREATGKPSVEG